MDLLFKIPVSMHFVARADFHFEPASSLFHCDIPRRQLHEGATLAPIPCAIDFQTHIFKNIVRILSVFLCGWSRRTNIVYTKQRRGKLYGRNFDAAVIVTSCSLRHERVDITQEIGEIKPFMIDRAH